MNSGQIVYRQLLHFLPRHDFNLVYVDIVIITDQEVPPF